MLECWFKSLVLLGLIHKVGTRSCSQEFEVWSEIALDRQERNVDESNNCREQDHSFPLDGDML